MNKSNRVDAVLLEEPSIGQDPDFPHQPAGLASAFSKALARVVDRFHLLFGKLPPSIKSHPSIAWGAGIALVVVVGFGAWRLLRSGTTVPANPRPARIERLENLARDAYKTGHYALPIETSSIAYSKRALELKPSNNYSRVMLENSINGGKYQVQQALKRKDFAKAHQVANAMDHLLPGRKDIAALEQDIGIAERGATASRRQNAVPHPKAGVTASSRQNAVPHPKAGATASFSAYHLHGDKAPADHGPYCLGILSVSGHHLKFSGRSASRGQKVHKFDFACSDVREIKKNPRIASRQGGFHVRTVSASLNSAPRASSPRHVSALAPACSK